MNFQFFIADSASSLYILIKAPCFDDKFYNFFFVDFWVSSHSLHYFNVLQCKIHLFPCFRCCLRPFLLYFHTFPGIFLFFGLAFDVRPSVAANFSRLFKQHPELSSNSCQNTILSVDNSIKSQCYICWHLHYNGIKNAKIGKLTRCYRTKKLLSIRRYM